MTVQVTQVSPTHQEHEGKGFVDFTQRYAFTFEDCVSKVFSVPVQAGEHVLGVRMTNTEAWVGGGNEDLTVGDGDDADGYIPAAAITAAAGQSIPSEAAAGAFVGGKAYAAAGVIKVTIISDAALTAGAGVLEVRKSGYGSGPERGEIKNLTFVTPYDLTGLPGMGTDHAIS